MLARPRFLFTIRGLMALVLMCGCLWSTATFLARVNWSGRTTGCGPTCQSNIRQIALGLIQYHSEYGSLPPAYVADRSGRPLYSWRVLILPYIDHIDTYNAFNFGQAWDGPDNLRISNTNILAFCCPAVRDFAAAPSATNYVAITGPGTAFPGAGMTTSATDFRDSYATTILVAEVADSTTHWAQPRDLDVSTMSLRVNDKSKPSLSSEDGGGPSVVMIDGSVRKLGPSVGTKTIRSLITINGGEQISPGELDR